MVSSTSSQLRGFGYSGTEDRAAMSVSGAKSCRYNAAGDTIAIGDASRLAAGKTVTCVHVSEGQGLGEMSGLSNRIRASLIVAIAYLAIAGGVLGFGIGMILDGIAGLETVPRSVIGILSIVLSLGIGVEAGELCFVTMDVDGIAQLKFFHRRHLIARARIAWEDVSSCRTKGLWVYLKSDSSEIRVNFSFFSDMGQAVMFMEDRLPKDAKRER